MTRKLALAVAGAAATMFAVVSAVQIGSAQTKSQWDGVYTAEQATAGEAIYAEKCSSCHGATLGGGEMAPALAGQLFATNWSGLSLGDLFERMRISMPQDDPGSLTRQQNVEVLAFMLSRGGYPAGETPLPTQTDALRGFKFLAINPAGN
ncbi:MAG: c-type cytochrome [Vicinamibacterales bacterium]